MSATPLPPPAPPAPPASPAPNHEDARTRRLYALAIGWGVATLALLWLFERAFEV